MHDQSAGMRAPEPMTAAQSQAEQAHAAREAFEKELRMRLQDVEGEIDAHESALYALRTVRGMIGGALAQIDGDEASEPEFEPSMSASALAIKSRLQRPLPRGGDPR